MHGPEPKDSQQTNISRRKFLTRTGTGLVIASLPVRSVWANGGGIANSIVASGHGSDFAGGEPLRLLQPSDVAGMSNNSPYNLNFYNTFKGAPFGVNGNTSSVSFRDITTNSNKQGPNSINLYLILVYLSAVHSGSSPASGIYYPIVGVSKPFSDYGLFARYLHEQATLNTSYTSQVLANLVHRPW